jgi:hypothetical protein
MLELSAIEAVDGSVHCQVKNMKMGDPDIGFTVYEGPIELALTNIVTRTFFAAKQNLLAAYEAFKFMRTTSVLDHESEIDDAFKVLVGQDGCQPILVGEIIDQHFLPSGIKELLYPFVRCHTCPIQFLPVMMTPKPIVRRDTMVLYLCDRTVVVPRDQVLYYRT